jgi:hypothetical protein
MVLTVIVASLRPSRADMPRARGVNYFNIRRAFTVPQNFTLGAAGVKILRALIAVKRLVRRLIPAAMAPDQRL